MLPENLKEMLGLEDSGLKDYEIVKRISEARERKLEEIEFVLKNGKKVKIRLKGLSPEGIIGPEVWGW